MKTAKFKKKPGSRPSKPGAAKAHPAKSARGSHPSRAPRASHAPRPLLFREAFHELWSTFFSSPKMKLDSALSKAAPSQKHALAEITKLFLQRPRSLAHYLRFQLSENEPWELSQEELTDWRTARDIANRLFQIWKRNPDFTEEGFPVAEDYPIYLTNEWRRDYGERTMRDLVNYLGQKAPMSLRASRLKGRNEVLSKLNDSGTLEIRGKTSKHTPYGFYFDQFAPVLNHPLFKEGAYEIQDEGSQIMALFALWPKEMLSLMQKAPGPCKPWPEGKEIPIPERGLTVIDACAGAGGKTLAMADALMGKGSVFAYDISDKKLAALKMRARRLGLHNVKTAVITEGKEAEFVAKHKNCADVVLVDAPCSGWGVMRRNPDIKWRLDKESYPRLEKLQEKLMTTYAGLVKPGGTLTYGVCTFRKKETTDQVESFLQHHPEFTSLGGGFYGPGPSDGFFFHAFKKKENK